MVEWSNLTLVLDVFLVENLLWPSKLNQQIKEHLQTVWNDNNNIVEISSLYNKSACDKTGEYEIIGQSSLNKIPEININTLFTKEWIDVCSKIFGGSK